MSGSAYNSALPDVMILAITSQTTRHLDYAYCEVIDWQVAGLLKPSLMKPIVATLEKSLLIKRLGSFSSIDLSQLKNVLELIKADEFEIANDTHDT